MKDQTGRFDAACGEGAGRVSSETLGWVGHVAAFSLTGMFFGVPAGAVMMWGSLAFAHAFNPEIRGTGLEILGGAIVGALGGTALGGLVGLTGKVRRTPPQSLEGKGLILLGSIAASLVFAGAMGIVASVPLVELLRLASVEVPAISDYERYQNTRNGLVLLIMAVIGLMVPFFIVRRLLGISTTK